MKIRGLFGDQIFDFWGRFWAPKLPKMSQDGLQRPSHIAISRALYSRVPVCTSCCEGTKKPSPPPPLPSDTSPTTWFWKVGHHLAPSLERGRRLSDMLCHRGAPRQGPTPQHKLTRLMVQACASMTNGPVPLFTRGPSKNQLKGSPKNPRQAQDCTSDTAPHSPFQFWQSPDADRTQPKTLQSPCVVEGSHITI